MSFVFLRYWLMACMQNAKNKLTVFLAFETPPKKLGKTKNTSFESKPSIFLKVLFFCFLDSCQFWQF